MRLVSPYIWQCIVFKQNSFFFSPPITTRAFFWSFHLCTTVCIRIFDFALLLWSWFHKLYINYQMFNYHCFVYFLVYSKKFDIYIKLLEKYKRFKNLGLIQMSSWRIQLIWFFLDFTTMNGQNQEVVILSTVKCSIQ